MTNRINPLNVEIITHKCLRTFQRRRAALLHAHFLAPGIDERVFRVRHGCDGYAEEQQHECEDGGHGDM
jgi:hypothetical protein